MIRPVVETVVRAVLVYVEMLATLQAEEDVVPQGEGLIHFGLMGPQRVSIHTCGGTWRFIDTRNSRMNGAHLLSLLSGNVVPMLEMGKALCLKATLKSPTKSNSLSRHSHCGAYTRL